ncbi:MAG: aminotransferase class V-fold PLP-dependent enzyme [Chloroflexota bacterium]|nr:aminotransferase class V-fold PLP-dependent enzyme [Chloroflexota bacterium]
MTTTLEPGTRPKTTTSSMDDREKLAHLRSQLPAVDQTGYFNAGTNGPLPQCALDAMIDAARRECDAGRIIPGVYEGGGKRNQRIRVLLGDMLGADPSEIALTHSTSEGNGTVLSGIDWQRGEEVVTTTLEHPGLFVPLSQIAHRYGIRLRIIDIGDGGGDVTSTLEAAMSPRTRVVALSHVMWSSGAVAPLRDVAAMARAHHALTLVDAAQAAGQVPIDLHEMGVDAYAIPGQKWLCGPEATGALYVRADRMADIQPTHPRYAQTDGNGYLLPVAGANRFEIGEFFGPAILAQEAALTWLRDEVGLDWAYSRVAALGQRCWEALAAIEGVTMASPKDKIAGLVCFQIPGMAPPDIAAKLYERGETIRYVAYPPGPAVARVSTGWWNSAEEIDRLADGVRAVVADHHHGTAQAIPASGMPA